MRNVDPLLDARCADAVVGQHRQLFTRDLEELVWEALEHVRIRAASGQLPRAAGFWRELLPRFQALCDEVACMRFTRAANDPEAASPSVAAYGPAVLSRTIGRSVAKSLHAVDRQDRWEMLCAVQGQPPKVADGVLLSIAEVRRAFLDEAAPGALEMSERLRKRYLALLVRLERAFRQPMFAFMAAA